MAEKKKSKMSETFSGLKSEFKKITWAEPKDVSKQTVAVVAVSVAVALIIIVIDAIVKTGVETLINL